MDGVGVSAVCDVGASFVGAGGSTPDMIVNISRWNSSSRFKMMADLDRNFNVTWSSVTLMTSTCSLGRALIENRVLFGLFLHKSKACALNSLQCLRYTIVGAQKVRRFFVAYVSTSGHISN